ncbi:molecular chaperone OsmY [Sodalis ligni]|jgi:hyperosmotically inducible protein|uniref:Osmotically-inducible protein Y n=1 Tax=Sodalis ligni TaxID=2697027 RepID=A0A4R1NNY9_9GAMM|nr:molecular chaperone OsmY [Sodalis ligni]QWA14054.1 molecular chaperone OsmY [Sodalis ligni]TCL06436.1 hyperosmotically inducible protein [Sodalis ligni]
MKNLHISQTLTALVLGTILAGTSAMANDTIKTDANSTAAKIDNSMKSASNYMGDSAVTAKVKSALVSDKGINSTDISVETNHGMVTLSGFVNDQMQAERAVTAAKSVDGVSSVSDKLHVKEAGTTAKSYASDSAITSEVKAKFLADSVVPSRKIKVTTDNGVVQLSGRVQNARVADRAESVAKAVDGVKSVKNDLRVIQKS